MIAYSFLPQGKAFYSFAHTDPLEALNWAKGPVLWQVELKGKITSSREGYTSENTQVIGNADLTLELQDFARRCAYRTLNSLSGANFCRSMRGIHQWLRLGRINHIRWGDLMHWAHTTEMTWMNGGHAEASICNALLCHSGNEQEHYHAWLAAAHARAVLGKTTEYKAQVKSLRVIINRKLSIFRTE